VKFDSYHNSYASQVEEEQIEHLEEWRGRPEPMVIAGDEGEQMIVESSGGVVKSRTEPVIATRFESPSFSLESCIIQFKDHDRRIRLEALANLKLAVPFLMDGNPEKMKPIEDLTNLLRETFRLEADDNIKLRIIECLSIFGQLPQIDSQAIIADLLSQLKNQSGSIRSSILHGLYLIATCKPIQVASEQTLEAICLEQLQSSHFLVRKHALEFLSRIVDSKQTQGKSNQIQALCSHFGSTDPDPRVRSAAWRSILNLHQRGFCLDIDLYKQAVESLNDDYEDVRFQCVEIIWILCNLHPSHVFTLHNEQIRLVDDGKIFSSIF
jgi:hypothetical protein